MTRHILVVGSGSVGRRHARNLAALGCRISNTDPRADRQRALATETPVVASHADHVEALAADPSIDAVVVAAPTGFHVEIGIDALQAGKPILMEKPLAMTGAGANRLLEVQHRTGIPVLMGYTWRWWPPLAQVRQLLNDGAIGKPTHVQLHMSAHLADWHPWERYQDFFMASKVLGGGALLDESHWLDLMLWLFGMPRTIFARVEKISDLEIESDDNVDMVFSYPGALRATMHLDLFGRPHEKFIRFVGTGGTLYWTAAPNELRIGRTGAQEWQVETFHDERNDMFMGVAREFLDVLNGKPVTTCTIAEGAKVMSMIDAARQSSATGQEVRLNGAHIGEF